VRTALSDLMLQTSRPEVELDNDEANPKSTKTTDLMVRRATQRMQIPVPE